MDEKLEEVLKRIEFAFKTSKPFVQLKDALILYKFVKNMNNKLAKKKQSPIKSLIVKKVFFYIL